MAKKKKSSKVKTKTITLFEGTKKERKQKVKILKSGKTKFIKN